MATPVLQSPSGLLVTLRSYDDLNSNQKQLCDDLIIHAGIVSLSGGIP